MCLVAVIASPSKQLFHAMQKRAQLEQKSKKCLHNAERPVQFEKIISSTYPTTYPWILQICLKHFTLSSNMTHTELTETTTWTNPQAYQIATITCVKKPSQLYPATNDTRPKVQVSRKCQALTGPVGKNIIFKVVKFFHKLQKEKHCTLLPKQTFQCKKFFHSSLLFEIQCNRIMWESLHALTQTKTSNLHATECIYAVQNQRLVCNLLLASKCLLWHEIILSPTAEA